MFFLGALLPAFFADRIGRRKPMMWGCAGCGISMMMIAILLSFKGSSVEQQTASAAIAFFFTVSSSGVTYRQQQYLVLSRNVRILTISQFTLIYGASASAIPWCYVPEILPLHARAKGTAIGISSNWLWVCLVEPFLPKFPAYTNQNFVIVMITPTMIRKISWKSYIVFMCTNFAFVPLIYFCYPETANLTLEEIDLLYNEHGTSARHVAEKYQKEIRQYGRIVAGTDTKVETEVVHDEGKA